MMQIRRLSAIVFTGLLLTVACKKEEEPTIDPCLNGQLDAGETAIDCGGSCGACVSSEYPYAGFSVMGESLIAETKQLTYNSGWALNVSNDSVSVQINLGSDGVVGTYSMSPVGSAASYNGINYPTLASGVFSISQHNTTTNKMSGFFQGNFTRGIVGDTLRIVNGFFEYLPY